MEETGELRHIIVDGTVSELGGDDLEDLTADPALFCHGAVGKPVRRETTDGGGRGGGCGLGLAGHGGEQTAGEDVAELGVR